MQINSCTCYLYLSNCHQRLVIENETDDNLTSKLNMACVAPCPSDSTPFLARPDFTIIAIKNYCS